MISNHAQFLDAIREKKRIRIVFYSLPDAGTIDRECAPLDYGPPPGTADELNRYWVWDYANTTAANPLGLLPDQIVTVNVLGKDFDPAGIPAQAHAWFVQRDWAQPREPTDPAPTTAAGTS